jgi:hypothetical protein
VFAKIPHFVRNFSGFDRSEGAVNQSGGRAVFAEKSLRDFLAAAAAREPFRFSFYLSENRTAFFIKR